MSKSQHTYHPILSKLPACWHFGLIFIAVPGKFLGIVGQDPSDSKSIRLHVDIFRFCFHSFEAYSSIDSSKMIGESPEVSNFNWSFLKLNRFICN
jgi:hypothetical protein